jgi:hypothetical protein
MKQGKNNSHNQFKLSYLINKSTNSKNRIRIKLT